MRSLYQGDLLTLLTLSFGDLWALRETLGIFKNRILTFET
jgi:hypothetical protein